MQIFMYEGSAKRKAADWWLANYSKTHSGTRM